MNSYLSIHLKTTSSFFWKSNGMNMIIPDGRMAVPKPGFVSPDFVVQEMPIKYSCCFCAACIGSLVLSDLLAGLLYDMAAKEQGRWLMLDTQECWPPLLRRVGLRLDSDRSSSMLISQRDTKGT